jgi:RNA methyltransferase, TrmH family
MLVSSRHNHLVKLYRQLREKSSLRRSMELFVVEGDREVGKALGAGFEVHTLFAKANDDISSHTDAIQVEPKLFASMALRESESLCGIFHQLHSSLADLSSRQGLFLAVHGVEKPGNLGAMFRSCDGVGAAGLIVIDPRCEVLNPNCIRSSLGAVFSVPYAVCGEDMFHAWAKDKHVLVSYIDPNSQNIFNQALPKDVSSTVLVVGSEQDGIPQEFCRNYKPVMIPMQGELDSLNVSVAAAVMLFQLRYSS